MGLRYFQRLMDILSRPSQFYAKAQKRQLIADRQKQFNWAMWFVLITYGLTSVISGLITLFGGALMGTLGYNAVWIPVQILLTIIIGFIVSFVWVAFVHLFVILFKGIEGYKETYRASAYAHAPIIPTMVLGTLFSLIPVIGIILQYLISIIAFIWTAVIEVQGLKTLQKLSTGKSVASLLLPFVLLFLIGIFIFILLVAFFTTFIFGLLGIA